MKAGLAIAIDQMVDDVHKTLPLPVTGDGKGGGTVTSKLALVVRNTLSGGKLALGNAICGSSGREVNAVTWGSTSWHFRFS